MVNQTLEYVKSCSLKAKKLQHLSEHLVTNGPEGIVSSKCFKSLELWKKSLQKIEGNIKELSTNPGFNIQLNLEALLSLRIENQHAVFFWSAFLLHLQFPFLACNLLVTKLYWSRSDCAETELYSPVA